MTRDTAIYSPVVQPLLFLISAAPKWLENGKPMSKDAAAGETVVFNCITDAIPEPVNFWFINSVPIESKFRLMLDL